MKEVPNILPSPPLAQGFNPLRFGAGLALPIVALALAGVSLMLLALLRATDVEVPLFSSEKAFTLIVFSLALGVLAGLITLCRVVFQQVITPTQNILRELPLDKSGNLKGLAKAASSVRTLRETVQHTQEQLDQSHRSLREAEHLALMGKLAASVAHSVRNPLTSVKLRLFSLQKGLNLNTRQKDDFEAIAASIAHLDTIVSNFLEFSRRPPLVRQKITLATVIDNALRLLRPRVEMHPIVIGTRHLSSVPLLYVDNLQLQEAMLNIMINCCEAMSYRGVLSIEGEYIPALGGQGAAIVRIQDTGPGIQEDILQDIFQPFFSTKNEGTGLGLPIAQSILEKHGGTLTVSNKHNAGATFILSIPLWTPETE